MRRTTLDNVYKQKKVTQGGITDFSGQIKYSFLYFLLGSIKIVKQGGNTKFSDGLLWNK